MKQAGVILVVGGMLIAGAAAWADGSAAVGSLIPFADLTLTNRALVRSVTDHYTMLRQYNARQFRARREHFEFLMDHMEATSVLAQKLGLINYRAVSDSDGRLSADNREGAVGDLLRVFAADGKRVYYVEGAHRGLFTVRGRGVVVVDFANHEPDTIEYTGALYVKVDNFVLATLAKLFSVFLGATVDHHFDHVMRNPISLSEKALTEPQTLLEQIGLLPEDDRRLLEPFAQLLRTGAEQTAPPHRL